MPVLQDTANKALKRGISLPKVLDENDVMKPRSIHIFEGYSTLALDFKETNEPAKVVQKTKDTIISLIQ